MWIARDKDGCLYLYEHKPTKLRGADRFIDKKDRNGYVLHIERELYPEVTFENSPVELVPKMETLKKESDYTTITYSGRQIGDTPIINDDGILIGNCDLKEK